MVEEFQEHLALLEEETPVKSEGAMLPEKLLEGFFSVAVNSVQAEPKSSTGKWDTKACVALVF